MTEPVHVLGIAGSLRQKSYDKSVLRAAAEMLPEGMTLKIYDIAPIPLDNADVEAHGDPEPVRHFKPRLAAANALLIATPEYNYSVPGVLKNALDQAPRPPATTPLGEKPPAIIGASGGPWGTARAHLAPRQTAVFMNMHPMNKLPQQIPHAEAKFDADLKLTDETTRQHLRAVLVTLAAWARRLNRV